jgi:SAM-dependent methyltransferase
MPDFGDNLFSGTANFYAKYRANYPAEIFADIVRYFDLDGHGKMLDLGSGTGELAIPLATYFDEVLAMDPDPEMLKQAKLKAQAAGTGNIEWQKKSSKGLKGVKGSFKLATLGQSLHWMNEKTAIDQLYELLEPCGGLFVVGGGGLSLLGSKDQNLQPKDVAIKNLVIKYLGPERRAGNSIYKSSDINWEQDLFPNSKFGEFTKRTYVTKIVRNINEELGNLYSMSWARREFFGSKIDEFEAELRARLSQISASQKFVNVLSFEAFFLIKK